MNYEQGHHSSNHADRMPPLFSIFKSVRHDEVGRIVENLPGEIESDPMLGKITLSFFGIPFELQVVTIIYTIVCTNP